MLGLPALVRRRRLFDGHFFVSPLLDLRSAARLDQRGLGKAVIFILGDWLWLGFGNWRRTALPRGQCGLRRRVGRLRILVPAMLARGASDLPPTGRNGAVLHHILRSATGAGEDHIAKSPLPGR